MQDYRALYPAAKPETTLHRTGRVDNDDHPYFETERLYSKKTRPEECDILLQVKLQEQNKVNDRTTVINQTRTYQQQQKRDRTLDQSVKSLLDPLD